MLRNGLALVAVLVLASGCAVMTPEQCEYADWMDLGERDARMGRPYEYIAERAKACRKADISPDAVAYRVGWDRGIVRYCTVDQGFADGLAGRAYSQACPTQIETEFLNGYSIGNEIHRARVARDAEDQAIRGLERILAEPGPDRTDAQLNDIQRDVERRRDNIRRLERELGVLEGRAQAMGFRL